MYLVAKCARCSMGACGLEKGGQCTYARRSGRVGYSGWGRHPAREALKFVSGYKILRNGRNHSGYVSGCCGWKVCATDGGGEEIDA
jgi:hypothetical protein